jgi:hypothetical protein
MSQVVQLAECPSALVVRDGVLLCEFNIPYMPNEQNLVSASRKDTMKQKTDVLQFFSACCY